VNHHKNLFLFSIISFFILLTIHFKSFAADCSATSKSTITPLLELYSSEGCSSCPPAEQWLSQLHNNQQLLSNVTPLAFHVDYWDGLGWKDRFANPIFTARQRHLNRLSNFVYTPQVMLNGLDFRRWASPDRYEAATNAYAKKLARVDLKMRLSENKAGDNALQLEVTKGKTQSLKNADIYIAVYQNGLISNVTAGENVGRHLSHNFVVRELLGPFKLNEDGTHQSTIELNSEWRSKESGVVTFVQDRQNGEIFQTLALKFCT